ncbi:MAG: hypothetical protein AAF212_04510 [Verrucomicrobiota bacterium]
MYRGSTQTTLSDIQLSLESAADRSRQATLITLFWGLIFAKCFIVEFAVQTYGSPVNSVIYVWGLSLTMACAITVINARGSTGNPLNMPFTSRLSQRLWVGAFVAMLIAGVGSITFNLFSTFVLPGLFATVLGFAFFVQSMLSQKRVLQAAAIGWWGVAIPLFALKDARSLLLFGSSLIFLQVIPAAIIWFKAKRASRG